MKQFHCQICFKDIVCSTIQCNGLWVSLSQLIFVSNINLLCHTKRYTGCMVLRIVAEINITHVTISYGYFVIQPPRSTFNVALSSNILEIKIFFHFYTFTYRSCRYIQVTNACLLQDDHAQQLAINVDIKESLNLFTVSDVRVGWIFGTHKRSRYSCVFPISYIDPLFISVFNHSITALLTWCVLKWLRDKIEQTKN